MPSDVVAVQSQRGVGPSARAGKAPARPKPEAQSDTLVAPTRAVAAAAPAGRQTVAQKKTGGSTSLRHMLQAGTGSKATPRREAPPAVREKVARRRRKHRKGEVSLAMAARTSVLLSQPVIGQA
jgi:hypothetical protein